MESDNRIGAAPRAAKAGFTLMELMAVVGIIVIMAALVVGGYSGIQRAMGTSTGADGLRRALSAARQQACVDGVDVYVWCVDRDKFIVCREGGVVSGALTGRSTQKPGYADGNGIDAWWVCDEYADLGQNAQNAYIDPASLGTGDSSNAGTAAQKLLNSDFLLNHRKTLVFDVTAKKACTYSFPAFYGASKDYEGWLFGLDPKERESGTFENGHEYAWALMPLQQLPGGFVFAGSWKNDGELDKDWMQRAYVHFYPDGRADCGLSGGFRITEAGVKNPYVQTVQVNGDGLVSVLNN